MPDDLNAVVLIRIVRRRDHHARAERPFARDERESWRGDQSREARAHAAFGQASRDLLRDPSAGFAGVHTNHHFAVQIVGDDPARQRHAGRESGRPVQRELSRNPPHAVGAEQLSHIRYSDEAPPRCTSTRTVTTEGESNCTRGSARSVFIRTSAGAVKPDTSTASVCALEIWATRVSGPLIRSRSGVEAVPATRYPDGTLPESRTSTGTSLVVL